MCVNERKWKRDKRSERTFSPLWVSSSLSAESSPTICSGLICSEKQKMQTVSDCTHDKKRPHSFPCLEFHRMCETHKKVPVWKNVNNTKNKNKSQIIFTQNLRMNSGTWTYWTVTYATVLMNCTYLLVLYDALLQLWVSAGGLTEVTHEMYVDQCGSVLILSLAHWCVSTVHVCTRTTSNGTFQHATRIQTDNMITI